LKIRPVHASLGHCVDTSPVHPRARQRSKVRPVHPGFR